MAFEWCYACVHGFVGILSVLCHKMEVDCLGNEKQ